MSKLVPLNLKLFNAEQFIESFTESGYNVYYFFVGKATPFEPSDSTPSDLEDTVQSVQIDAFEEMIYGKRLTSTDVIQMVPRYDWTSNTVYQKYQHDNPTLYDEKFYVVVDEDSFFSVFKCLDNNSGAPSTVEPTATGKTLETDDFYFTADGYQWKYMYAIPSATFEKYATSQHIPVVYNANVVVNAKSGSIDNIEMSFSGNGYASYSNGTFQDVIVGGNPKAFNIDPSRASSNNGFYIGCAVKITSGTGSGQQRKIAQYTTDGADRTIFVDEEFSVRPTATSTYEISPYVSIIGDGTGALARAIVNASSNTISKIEVSARGLGYTFAEVEITGNTGIISVSNTTIANNATARIIVSPKGGHGSNAYAELGARFAGISVTFDSVDANNKIIDSNDFRSIGIIKDPLFTQATLTIQSPTGTFFTGEKVSQANTGAYGYVVSANSTTLVLTSAYKYFAAGNSTVNKLLGANSGYLAEVVNVTQPTTYIDQTVTMVGSMQSVQEFIEDEPVTQGNNATGYMYFANSSTFKVVGSRGSFNATTNSASYFLDGDDSIARAIINSVTPGDLVKNSGDVIYRENFTAITRSPDQTETFKLILEF